MASPAASPYSVNLGQADALELVKEGASLLILDMPANTIFGFDLHMLTVGPLFKGLKMISPGPHFVYYSATARRKYGNGHEAETQGGGEYSVVTGFFIHLDPGEVLVRHWDPREELLVKVADSEQEEKYKHAVRRLEFDRFLGSYDVHRYQAWKRLTFFITPQVIERIEPVGGNISVVAEAELDENMPKSPAEQKLDEYLKRGREERYAPIRRDLEDHRAKRLADQYDHCMETNEEDSSQGLCCDDPTVEEMQREKPVIGRCFYTTLPNLVLRAGASPAEISMLNVDKSVVLQGLLNDKYNGSEDLLLGELQFTFVAFLMGQSLESFNQWKCIVCLLLSCDEAPLHTHTRLFVKFLGIVGSQLQLSLKSANDFSDMPFLEDSWFSEDNFLLHLWKAFYQSLTEAHPIDGDLLKETRRLKATLESLLGWKVDYAGGDFASYDEYAPVVVMDEDLRDYQNM